MKKTAVVVVLTLIVALAVANSAHAEWKWKDVGADPYAKTRAEAMENREKAFKDLGIPGSDIPAIIEATEKAGERTTLGRGDHLKAMRSGSTVQKDVVVDVDSMPTEAWKVVLGKRIYLIFLPYDCNNWSYYPSIKVTAALSTPMSPTVSPPGKKDEGCAEIRFLTKAESGDTVVKFPVLGPDGPDLSKDPCTGVKRPGANDFSAWVNEACPTDSLWLCDFSDSERVAGQKVQLKGSINITAHGEHVLRLPAYVAANDSKYAVLLYLVRKGDKFPPYPEKRGKDEVAYHEAIEYAKQRQQWISHHSDAMAILWFGYENAPTGKVAKVYYSKEETPLDAPQVYWSWNQWIGKVKVMPVPWQ